MGGLPSSVYPPVGATTIDKPVALVVAVHAAQSQMSWTVAPQSSAGEPNIETHRGMWHSYLCSPALYKPSGSRLVRSSRGRYQTDEHAKRM
jgi:hypothetical protein